MRKKIAVAFIANNGRDVIGALEIWMLVLFMREIKERKKKCEQINKE